MEQNNTEEPELSFDNKEMNTMLEYENQIFLEILHKDGLVVTAKGITIDVILTNLLKVYCDPGNLVIVMNYGDNDEKYYTKKLCGETVFSASLNVNEREINYLMGGIHFVTTRILVIDLLKKRIPIDKITGIFVLRAHTVLESCQEAFALRLYRQNNKSGFIKAFSNCAESFTYGFGHVERIMRSLLVKELFIWPRFHSLIRQSLKANEPAIVELHVPVSKTVASIQTAVLELMNDTVKELKRINKTLEMQEITVENCVAKKYHKILQAQLDCVWHQLSARSRQLIADLKTLRHLIMVVLYDDPITFHSVVSQYRTAEYAQTCTWALQDSAEQLFGIARRLVFSADGKLDPEPPSKWAVLSDILTVEIPAEPFDEESRGILLLCQDNKTCFQLSQYLKHGADKYLFLMAMKHGVKHAGLSARLERLLGSDVTLAEFERDAKRPRTDKADADADADTCGLFEEMADYENCRPCYVLTMSQVSSETTHDPRPDYTFDEFPEMEQMELSTAGRGEPLLVIQTFNAPALQSTLEELRPRYVIMYHSSVTAVRQIETYASRALAPPPRVYFLVHAGTVEEQSYLTTLRRERQAFEHLISTKATMVAPDELDCGAPTVEPTRNSRHGGRTPQTDPHTIIVDMREFRSDLPALIHRRGIRIEPVTIAVGDYVLTSDVCVERKSLSDLIGSLNSGRLYQQCTHMSRHYAKPMLLIEFDQNQPFKFQFRGRYMASSEPAGEADTQKKLQLLTMHFPRLKIVWSPSPYASAQLFEELKEGQPQPSLEYANAINTESDIESIEKKYNTNVYDFIQKLPGINTKNIHGFLRNCKNLVEALTKSQDELKEILGNSSDAKLFYDILHEKPSQPNAASKKAPFRKKFTRNKFL